jgi:hypothetical protein
MRIAGKQEIGGEQEDRLLANEDRRGQDALRQGRICR